MDLESLLRGPVDEIAPRLLGAELEHAGVCVRITEVEAYGGANDAGSHAYRGRRPRNQVMFGPPGRLYVYLAYGMHVCANVVCAPEGEASAVLLRAGQIVDGVATAIERRDGARPRDLARGPGRLCRALGLARDHDGVDLASSDVRLRPAGAPVVDVRTGPRVGLRAEADREWRFWLPDEPTVSVYRRHPRALAPPDLSRRRDVL